MRDRERNVAEVERDGRENEREHRQLRAQAFEPDQVEPFGRHEPMKLDEPSRVKRTQGARQPRGCDPS
jgi:hypothetical protein